MRKSCENEVIFAKLREITRNFVSRKFSFARKFMPKNFEKVWSKYDYTKKVKFLHRNFRYRENFRFNFCFRENFRFNFRFRENFRINIRMIFS
jgi:hypothetical protein